MFNISDASASSTSSSQTDAPSAAANQSDLENGIRRLGMFTPNSLARAVGGNAAKPFLVEGLLRTKSLNLFVGDSNIGKTPFGIQLGLCIAAGLAFLGRKTEPGPVLYCDAESDSFTFLEMLTSISKFLGLRELPDNFVMWSPNWQTHESLEDGYRTWAQKVIARAEFVKPALVIVDPLRMFWPDLETGNERVPAMVKSLREVSRNNGTSWLITHHKRKVNQNVAATSLADDPRGWFQDAAGSHGIVNQTDTRIGVVDHPGVADLLVGGFMRSSGPFVPLDVARRYNDEGNPVGYELLTGLGLLSADDRAVYVDLPERFSFTQVKRVLGGTSDSNTSRLLRKCMEHGVLLKNGKEYVKVQHSSGMESVECVEESR